MISRIIRAIQVAWYKRKVARRLERAKFDAMRDEKPKPQLMSAGSYSFKITRWHSDDVILNDEYIEDKYEQ